MINQMALNPNAVQQHRKQQSQINQVQEIQRLPSQGRGAAVGIMLNSGSNQDLNNNNKTPESNKKRSRGELSAGGFGNVYSYDRRTYDARGNDADF